MFLLFGGRQGYTNADNPFGDEHLLDTFVWQKKLEKEGKSDLTQVELEKIQKTKMMESKVVCSSFLYFTVSSSIHSVGSCSSCHKFTAFHNISFP